VGFLTYFPESLPSSNFTEIRPVSVVLVHAETRTDWRTWRS